MCSMKIEINESFNLFFNFGLFTFSLNSLLKNAFLLQTGKNIKKYTDGQTFSYNFEQKRTYKWYPFNKRHTTNTTTAAPTSLSSKK